MPHVPLFLKVDAGDQVVLIGGGRTALAKSESLRRVAGNLRVVAKAILPELCALVRAAGGSVSVQSYVPEVLTGARLVIAATSDPGLNRRIHRDARALGLLVNVVDDPALCDVFFPAVVERGDIQIAISTGGINPTLARVLKRRIELMLPGNLAALGDWLRQRRDSVATRLSSLQARRLFWEDVLDGPIAQEVLEGSHDRAERLFREALERAPDGPRAAFYLIGTGPGHPDSITVQAAQRLSRADVILFDRLVPRDVLTRYARRDAEKIPTGRIPGEHVDSQDGICALIAHHLQQDRIVARLMGGDSATYSNSAEEVDVAVRLGVPFQIVPGSLRPAPAESPSA